MESYNQTMTLNLFVCLCGKTKKLGGLAHMRDCSIETIKNEMDKCVILCANDHRRVTVGKIELPARSK